MTQIIASSDLNLGTATKRITKAYINKGFISSIYCTNDENGGYIKFDNTQGKWIISNDGQSPIDIGSGISPAATKLETGRKINGVLFDGTSDISINAPSSGGHADSSTLSDKTEKLKTERTITLTGDASGYTNFDGSKDVSLNITIPKSSVLSAGLVQMATDTEVDTAVSSAKSVSPASLKKGLPNGVATLDQNSKIPNNQMPITVSTSKPSPTDGNNGDFWVVIS